MITVGVVLATEVREGGGGEEEVAPVVPTITTHGNQVSSSGRKVRVDQSAVEDEGGTPKGNQEHTMGSHIVEDIS